MVKPIFLLLLMLTGPVSWGQTLTDDAAGLKNRRRDLWYADSSFHQPESHETREISTAQKRTTDQSLLKKIVGTMGYLTAALILGALVYAFYNFTRTGKPKKTKAQQTEEDNIETVDDLYQADFTARIALAEASGNFRLALRYYYLRLLQEFSRQSLIRYEKNKTNKQYAEEIKNHKWGPDFRLATHYYNFVWYGERPLNRESYQSLVPHFKKMLAHE